MKYKRIKDKNYHGFLNDLSPKDARISLYKKQYKKHGFDDTETWSLDYTIASFILPRLKRYRNMGRGHPTNMTLKEWNTILDKMIKSFEDTAKGNECSQEGLELFANHFRNLWN